VKFNGNKTKSLLKLAPLLTRLQLIFLNKQGIPYSLYFMVAEESTTPCYTQKAFSTRHVTADGKGKGKAVPLQAWIGPEGSRKLRFPDFITTAHDGGKVVSLTYQPPLPPGNTPGTHFYWRVSRPQGHSTTGRIVTEKFQ